VPNGLDGAAEVSTLHRPCDDLDSVAQWFSNSFRRDRSGKTSITQAAAGTNRPRVPAKHGREEVVVPRASSTSVETVFGNRGRTAVIATR
jgi:hypothetical protein